MGAQRKSLDSFAVTAMLVLRVLWGLQQVVVKKAAPHMGPVLQIGLRSLAAAVLVLGAPLDPRFVAGALLVMGGVVMVNVRK